MSQRTETGPMPRDAAAGHPQIIDAHAHVKWYGYDAGRLVENMDEHGIDVMWLLTWEAPPEETGGGNVSVFWPGRRCMPLEDVLEAVEQYPDRFVPFFAPDPRTPDALARLQGAIKYHGIRGVGELKVRIMMDDPRALQLFRFCGENALPVVFHVDVPLPDRFAGESRWYCCHWENLARALELCPETIFCGHGPGFWREISANADSSKEGYPEGAVTPEGKLQQYLDTYPNLYCDLSAGSGFRGLSRTPGYGAEFLLKYQDRCLFGRDYFDARLHKFIKSCNLPAQAVQKIMCGNALRLVAL